MRFFAVKASDFVEHGTTLNFIAQARGRSVTEIALEFEDWYKQHRRTYGNSRERALEYCKNLAFDNKLLPWEQPDYQI